MKTLTTVAIAVVAYIGMFILLVIVNGVASAGMTDQEFGRSASLAIMNIAAKGLLAMTIGFVAGVRLPRVRAVALTLVLTAILLVLAQVLPAGAFILSVFAGDPLWLHLVVLLLAAGAAAFAEPLVRSLRTAPARSPSPRLRMAIPLTCSMAPSRSTVER